LLLNSGDIGTDNDDDDDSCKVSVPLMVLTHCN
jgi:hypothetical protein